jgi:hypothetical protein
MSSHQLLRAAKHGHSDRMIELLSEGADVESTDSVRYDVIFWRAIFSIFRCVLSVYSIDDELDVRDRRMPSSWFCSKCSISYSIRVNGKATEFGLPAAHWVVGTCWDSVSMCDALHSVQHTHIHTRTGWVLDADVDRSVRSRGLRATAAGCRR